MVDSTTIVVAAITAIPPTLVALGAWRQGWNNGKKADVAAASADLAAANASAAAVKVEEVHTAAQGIAAKSDQIAAQTNGHLTQLTAELKQLTTRNEALEKTVTTLVNIITATRVLEANNEGKDSITVPSVRTEDLNQAIQTIQEIKSATPPDTRVSRGESPPRGKG